MKSPWSVFCLATVLFAFAGCGKPAPSNKPTSANEQTSEQDDSDSDFSAPEQAAIHSAKPFLDAIAQRDYDTAYDLLSSYAKARMSPNQFEKPPDDETFKANEEKAIINPTKVDFITFMGKVETNYGLPVKIESITGAETDSKVLSGKGDAIETAFTIGNIPDTIPAEIRKAAVRAQIGIKLTPEELQQVAKEEGMTVEELEKSPDFSPYLNLETVLVEEGGELKVGYFEFTPRSMWD